MTPPQYFMQQHQRVQHPLVNFGAPVSGGNQNMATLLQQLISQKSGSDGKIHHHAADAPGVQCGASDDAAVGVKQNIDDVNGGGGGIEVGEPAKKQKTEKLHNSNYRKFINFFL